jgi:hypothetical protein
MKIEQLLRERVNPHLIGCWCTLHCAQLLLKDCFFEISEFKTLRDHLPNLRKFFRFPKTYDLLWTSLGVHENAWKGVKTLKRALNLTRWSSVKMRLVRNFTENKPLLCSWYVGPCEIYALFSEINTPKHPFYTSLNKHRWIYRLAEQGFALTKWNTLVQIQHIWLRMSSRF